MKNVIYILIMVLYQLQTSYSCDERTLILKSESPFDHHSFSLKIESYKNQYSKKKQIIILPSILGKTKLEQKYAKELCNNGVSTYIFSEWNGRNHISINDLSIHEQSTQQTLFAIELFLKKFPLKTNILGNSSGAIYAAIALGKFELIQKAVIVAGGTNLAGILTHSSLAEIKQLRDERFKYFGFKNKNEYEQALRLFIFTGPEDYMNSFSSKKIFMVKTKKDTVIPYQYQQDLYQLFSDYNIKSLVLNLEHRQGIIWTVRRKLNSIIRFLI